MRTAPVLAAALFVAGSGCTYSIPGLAPGGSDGGVSTLEASAETSTGGDDDGESPADTGGGPTGDASTHMDASGGCTVACPCAHDSDCTTAKGAEGICAQSADVGGDLGHTGFCSQPCCTSANCDPGTVCFASGAGGSYCVDPAWLGRSSTLGGDIGGATCTGNAQCRSGLCTSGKCADTCCSFADSSAECASGTQCAFGAFPGTSPDIHFAARCALPGGAQTAGSNCSDSSQCAGGLCYTNTGMGVPPYCVAPCSTSAECGGGFACQLDVQADDIYAGCFNPEGQGAQGTACNDGFEQCLGGLCSAAGECTNICFSNTVCQSGWRCEPMLDSEYPPGSPTVLACGP
ncbi:MAG TPA: hypothetical protein VGL81_02325 [Polyangiaceae bacterium]|jgi:hypothetical protein